jgi:hypothetical protein
MAKGILIAAIDFSAVPADEFNDWYDTEHIPERATGPRLPNSPALDRGREPQAIGRNLRPRYPCGSAKP